MLLQMFRTMLSDNTELSDEKINELTNAFMDALPTMMKIRLQAAYIDCQEAEKDLKTTPGSVCSLNALAIDEPLEYAKLYLDGTMQIWVDADDTLYL